MDEVNTYLRAVLAKYHVDTGINSPLRLVQATIDPTIRGWGGHLVVGVGPSGSFAKGTAVKGGTDIDIFISLSSTVIESLQSIHDKLYNAFSKTVYYPRRQNVSIGLSVNGWKVDVTPGRRQDQYSNTHSLWSNKTSSWLQTNVNEHIRVVSRSGRLEEIRLLKIWRNRFGIDWLSFYLELFVIDVLHGRRIGDLGNNIKIIFEEIVRSVHNRRLLDPSNTNNIVSNTLGSNGKEALADFARASLKATWNELFV